MTAPHRKIIKTPTGEIQWVFWHARVYLKTPDAPGQRAFSRCAASFFLEIRQYSCEKMSCSAQKFLAAGHIMSFQIHPRDNGAFDTRRGERTKKHGNFDQGLGREDRDGRKQNGRDRGEKENAEIRILHAGRFGMPDAMRDRLGVARKTMLLTL